MTDLPTSAPRRAALVFILVTIVLDMLALGVIVPVLPNLILEFEGGNTASAARIVGVFATVWALMQFVFSPVLGALSDRYGRRRVILISNFGLGCNYVLMAVAPNLAWLFVGRLVSGVTAASMSTAYAYIADVTPPERRAAGFGLLGAATGLGFVLGPALGGLLGGIDLRLPFWTAAGLSLLNALYGLFILPESLPLERRSSFSWRRANPLGSLRFLGSHPELAGLASAAFLSNLAHVVLPSTFVLYAGYRYGWDARAVGLTLAAVGSCSAIVQGGLVRQVVRHFGERRSLLAGLLFGAAGFAIYGAAESGFIFLLGVPVMALWGLAGPSGQSLMSRRVALNEQGRLQGANSSIMGIAGMVGPGIFTLVFASFIGPQAGLHLPGAPFLLASLMLLASMALAWKVTHSESGS